ncbi:hypothetical protein BDP81DRAFT_74677 [Colletotrichum phormii]|uniref:Uncharacterized protein n=1 Tax=Colletotrichum phormii TaxID=359342 RepID=A0AAJ0EBG7_9PEZI|nr:uncharacterized protein BDP81DRAFT_74677 [Colletotrichum phormii]KAK1625591.1 hypothetical protein BDP81DRAFT_74677 [Colletotrichum phormii]
MDASWASKNLSRHELGTVDQKGHKGPKSRTAHDAVLPFCRVEPARVEWDGYLHRRVYIERSRDPLKQVKLTMLLPPHASRDGWVVSPVSLLPCNEPERDADVAEEQGFGTNHQTSLRGRKISRWLRFGIPFRRPGTTPSWPRGPNLPQIARSKLGQPAANCGEEGGKAARAWRHGPAIVGGLSVEKPPNREAGPALHRVPDSVDKRGHLLLAA